MLKDLNDWWAPAKRAIRRIKDLEMRQRRQVRGRDFNDWDGQLRAWRAAGECRQSLRLLLEIIAAAETLPQYDPRESRYEWYLWAAIDY